MKLHLYPWPCSCGEHRYVLDEGPGPEAICRGFAATTTLAALQALGQTQLVKDLRRAWTAEEAEQMAYYLLELGAGLWDEDPKELPEPRDGWPVLTRARKARIARRCGLRSFKRVAEAIRDAADWYADMATLGFGVAPEEE